MILDEVRDCAVCHAATQSMAQTISSLNAPKPHVIDVIESTCQKLPAAYNSEVSLVGFKKFLILLKILFQCRKLVNVYGESMINIITGTGDWPTVCTQIGMCYPDEYASFAQITRTKKRQQIQN